MKNKDFSYYLSKFLTDYLIIERNLSNNTVKSYKKTFQLLIEFLVNEKKMKLSSITFSNISRDLIIEFLNYLENTKNNSIRTRNQRLAAIKSFFQYCSVENIENIENFNKTLSIKSKKFTKKVINYLTEDEIKKIFDSIDTSSKKGRRNLTILVLIYDTGARASEITNLKYEDINLNQKYIILTGKGNKQRIVPIMEQTKELLVKYFKENNINEGNIFSKTPTYELIRYLFKKINKIIDNKNITPHVFRHTRAVHLLDNGVPLIYIKELLGHSSIITTEEYAKVIEKRKFEAIEKVTITTNNSLDDWNDDQDLLSHLLNL